MLEVKIKVRQSDLNKLNNLSDKGYVYTRYVATNYLPDHEREQFELVVITVENKAQAEEVSKLLEQDVHTSTTQLIKFTPEIEVSEKPVGKLVHPTAIPGGP